VQRLQAYIFSTNPDDILIVVLFLALLTALFFMQPGLSGVNRMDLFSRQEHPFDSQALTTEALFLKNSRAVQ